MGSVLYSSECGLNCTVLKGRSRRRGQERAGKGRKEEKSRKLLEKENGGGGRTILY